MSRGRQPTHGQNCSIDGNDSKLTVNRSMLPGHTSTPVSPNPPPAHSVHHMRVSPTGVMNAAPHPHGQSTSHRPSSTRANARTSGFTPPVGRGTSAPPERARKESR